MLLLTFKLRLKTSRRRDRLIWEGSAVSLTRLRHELVQWRKARREDHRRNGWNCDQACKRGERKYRVNGGVVTQSRRCCCFLRRHRLVLLRPCDDGREPG